VKEKTVLGFSKWENKLIGPLKLMSKWLRIECFAFATYARRQHPRAITGLMHSPQRQYKRDLSGL
jgi:hypothetical protein